MALTAQQICDHLIGKTVVSAELDYGDNTIILELSDSSYIEISGEELSIYAELNQDDDTIH
tara:strand:- start:551 stop:733 length:183 start_codon:yes stop_codon:yes gene_type:complete